jgi:phenylalanyl-tRNA synthetase beta chain
LNEDSHILVNNPISRDQSVMRRELISSLLKNTADNLRYLPEFRILELGKVYLKTATDSATESFRLSGAAVGEAENFYNIKGCVEKLLESFNIKYQLADFIARDNDYLTNVCVMGETSEIRVADQIIGALGTVKEDVARNFGVKNNKVYFFDIDFDKLMTLADNIYYYTPLPKYPAVELDVSMVVDETLPWATVERLVKQIGGELIEKLELFDVYVGRQIAGGKKSMAFRIVYRSQDHTLITEEVQKVQDRIVSGLESDLKAEIRK